MGKKYVDNKGRLIFASVGLGGNSFMTMYQDAGKWGSGGMHRLKSPALPVRKSIEKAQADLDAYAAPKGWKVKDPEPTCGECEAYTDDPETDRMGKCSTKHMWFKEDQEACKAFKRKEGEEVAKKKIIDIEAQLLKLMGTLERSHADWEYTYKNGCRDPFWSDGTNLNLIHNHIIYERNELKEFCESNQLSLPEILNRQIPEEVDKDYMANGYLEGPTMKPVRNEREDMAKQTYYTKCGRQFEKSSTAGVTGYELKEEMAYMDTPPYAGRITDDECRVCPFVVDVADGWGDNKKHIRWECRAGSKPPNQKDDWVGDLKGKATVHIRSLHNDFLESILEYCKADPDLSAGYNQDTEDCRRQISVLCSSNKKGIAAKKALIEKFFPAAEAAPDERYENNDDELFDEQKCRVCGCTDNNACEGGCYWVEDDLCSKCAETCETCEHSEDWGESVEYIKCTEGKKRKDVKKKQDACANYIPVRDIIDDEPESDLEEQLDELLKDGDEEASICETDESRTIAGSGSCVSGTSTETAISTADKPAVTTAEGLKEEKEDMKEMEALIEVRPLSLIEAEISFYKAQTANGIFEIGKRLIEAKEQIPHGDWEQWLEEKVEFSQNTAGQFMRVAREFSNSEPVKNLGTRKIFALLGVPDESRDEFINQNNLQNMTSRQVEAAVKEWKEKLKKAEIYEAQLIREKLSLKDQLKDSQESAAKQAKWAGEHMDNRRKAEKIAENAEKEVKLYQSKIVDLNQQLTQAKSNGDTAKVQSLEKKMLDYQEEIDDYQQQIGKLNVQIQEKNKQLHEKPIEVPAARVVEKVVIPDEVRVSIYNKVTSLYEGIMKLTETEIQIFAEDVDPDQCEEVTTELKEAAYTLDMIENKINAIRRETAYREATPAQESDFVYAADDPARACGCCKKSNPDYDTDKLENEDLTYCPVWERFVHITDNSCYKFESVM